MKQFFRPFLILLVLISALLIAGNISVSARSDKATLKQSELNPRAKNALLNRQGNKFQVQLLDEAGQELPPPVPPVVDEFQIDEENGDGDVTLQSNENAASVIRNKLSAQTHFPLMVNLDTNELIVTTPKGSKIVTILPDQAVQNMLAANVLDQLGGKGGLLWLEQQATPSASPTATPSATPTATPSASPTASPSASPEATLATGAIVLTLDEDGNLVYEITGVKFEKLLGLLRVALNRVVVVSAETGELLAVRQNLLTRLLDLFSV